MGCGVSRGSSPDAACTGGAKPGPVVEHSLGSQRSFRGAPAAAVKASPVSFYVSDALRIFSRTLQGAMGTKGTTKGKVSPLAGASSPEHRAAPGSPGGAAAAAGLEAVRRLRPGEAAVVALTHAQSYGLLHGSPGGTADCKGGRDSASLWELRRERDDDSSSEDVYVTALNLGTGSLLAHDGGRPCTVHPAALKPGGGSNVEATEAERKRRCVFRCILHPKEGSLSLVAAGAPGAESVGQVIGRGGRPLPARYCLGASNSGALKELRTVGAAGDGGRFYATTPGAANGGAFALTVADRGESVGRAAVKDIAWRPEHHAAAASPPRR